MSEFTHDREAIRTLFKQLEKALASDRLSTIEGLIHADFSAVLPPDAPVAGYAGLFTYYQALIHDLELGTVSLSLNIERTQELAEGVALVTGTANEKRLAGSTAQYLDARWTAVLVRPEGEWQLMRLHLSLDPLNNPYSGARTQGVGLAAGAVGALLGAGAAALIGSRRPRRANAPPPPEEGKKVPAGFQGAGRPSSPIK